MSKVIVWADGSWEWEHCLTGKEYNQLWLSDNPPESFDEDDPLLPNYIREEILKERTCTKIYNQFCRCLEAVLPR